LKRFDGQPFDQEGLQTVEVNFLEQDSLSEIPDDIDIAFYLIHSMATSIGDFDRLEKTCAENFKSRIEQTSVKQVIYLSGIVNAEKLSHHLESRRSVEHTLAAGSYHLTTLRAGIIVGSGSASFEIIRDLVEKLPIMIAPKWLNTKSQPIAVGDVIRYLTGVIDYKPAFDGNFDIGGPEVLTYKDMLLKMAKVRGLNRKVYTVPVMTPKLSSYWLYFVTSTSYRLAINLVNSMKVEIVCNPNDLGSQLGIQPMTYEEAVSRAFDRIAQQEVLSSWTDALSRRELEHGLSKFLEVPTYGCLKDNQQVPIRDEQQALNNMMSIGGERGWYYANWLWKLRGFIDKMLGGVGLRRGRKNQTTITTGESLDFWRVLYASRPNKRLLLYAEMKLPGEAWLEFAIKDQLLYQTATFRPKGVWGRLYWYASYPFHAFIFSGMARRVANSTDP
jgi:uncharacterized protein YbjT (DUF2867 family)